MNGARASQGEGLPAFGADEEPGPASTPAPPGQAAEPSEAERPLTRAEFAQAMEQQRQAMARQIQSQTDKAATHIQRRFQAAQDGFTRAAELAVKGGFIPADKQEAYALHLRQAAMQDALTPEAPAHRNLPRNGSGQRPAPEPLDDPDDGDADVAGVNAQAQTLAQQYGLGQGDPELEHVYTAGTPAEYLTSIKIAGQAKARRLAAASPAPAAESETPDPAAQAQARQRRAAARAPGLGPSTGKGAPTNPIANINDPDKLFDLEWQNATQRGPRTG